MKKISKTEYNVLICDDNIHYIKRLQEGFSEINKKSNNFHINIDVGTTPSKCMTFIQNTNYDIIILDVCIKNNDNNNTSTSDLLYFHMGIEYYGTELYKQILEQNPIAKVFVLSNLPIIELRRIFNDADVEYFNKTKSKITEIVQCIKNYFDTGKERIYNNAFIVYGHNRNMRVSVENYIKSIGLNSIDLFTESPGGIQSVFDALDECTNSAECAIILLSADDIVLNKQDLQMYYRARQNVIFEMGLFAGYLGKDKIIVLYEKNEKFEFPSDITGVFYIEYDKQNNWKEKLEINLKKIGFVL